MRRMSSTPSPADPVAAWRALNASDAAVHAALEYELRREHDLSTIEFEVLDNLGTCATGKSRMQELAEVVHATQSTVSRVVARLEDEGLASRSMCADDRRGIFASLTPEGEARRARPPSRPTGGSSPTRSPADPDHHHAAASGTRTTLPATRRTRRAPAPRPASASGNRAAICGGEHAVGQQRQHRAEVLAQPGAEGVEAARGPPRSCRTCAAGRWAAAFHSRQPGEQLQHREPRVARPVLGGRGAVGDQRAAAAQQPPRLGDARRRRRGRTPRPRRPARARGSARYMSGSR